jgi:hypothetical protein
VQFWAVLSPEQKELLQICIFLGSTLTAASSRRQLPAHLQAFPPFRHDFFVKAADLQALARLAAMGRQPRTACREASAASPTAATAVRVHAKKLRFARL